MCINYAQARIIAENLVQEVQTEVTQREAEEATKLAAELETLDKTMKKKSSKAMAAMKAAAVQNTRKQLQLFHHSKIVGTAAEPCDVLVMFDVMIDGIKHGRTEAVRGCYSLAYDEHIIDVRSATNAIAAVTTGRLPTGTSAPTSTPLLTNKPTDNKTNTTVPNTQTDSDESEGIVGTYAANILCTLPDLSDIIKGSNLPLIPEEILQMAQIIYQGETITDETKLQQLQSFSYEALLSSSSADSDQESKTNDSAVPRFSSNEGAGWIDPPPHVEINGGKSEQKSKSNQPRISLYPRFSPNGGVDWVDPPPHVEIICLKPEASHISPPSACIVDSSISVNVKGMGFLPGAPASVNFKRLNNDGSYSNEMIDCTAVITDSSTVNITLPNTIRTLFPPVDNHTEHNSESSSSSPVVNGYCTLSGTLYIDGLPVYSPRPLLITVFTGTFLPLHTVFIGPSGAVTATLAPPTVSSYDGITNTNSDTKLSWIPLSALHGTALTGLRSVPSVDVVMNINDDHGITTTIPAVYDSNTNTITGTLPTPGEGEEPLNFTGQLHANVTFGATTTSPVAISLDGNIVYYHPHNLAITAVNGPKKILPGSELQIIITDLHTLVSHYIDSEHGLSEGSIVVRLTANGHTENVHGHLAADHSSINFILPHTEELIGDVNVEVSLSSGIPSTSAFSPPFLIKTVKK